MYARLPTRPSTYVVAAVLWLVLVVVADLLLPEDVVPTALLSVAPLIASARLGVRGTAGFGVAALALAVWSGFWNDAWADPQHWVRMLLVALIAIAATSIARVRGERPTAPARKGAKGPAKPISADTRRVEEALRKHLGTDVKLTPKRRGRGIITLQYYSNDDLARVLELILGRPFDG